MPRCESLRRPSFVLALCLVCQMAMAAPKAVVEPVKINLGVIKQGTIAESSFTIRNEGDEPLDISKIQISCPCTTVDIPDPNIVAPGASVTLPVHYDSKDRFGDSTATIAITLNDPAMPFAIVDLDVNVKTLVVTKPDKVYEFGLAPRGYDLKKFITIGAGEKNADIEVVDLRLELPTMTVKAEKTLVKEFTRVDLKFALTADAPLGDYVNRIVAKLRVGGEDTEVRMPIQGYVVGDVVVLPPAIHDPIKAYIQGEHISEITVRPSVNNTRCPKVLGALAVGPLKASIMPNPPENKYVISVDAADNAPGGPRSGTIYVMTASKDQPVVGIPVYFKVAKALDAKPENLVFSMAAGVPAAQKVELLNPQGKSFTIKDIRYESDLVNATIVAASPTNSAPAAIEVVPTGKQDPARAAAMVILVTDCPGAEEFLVPVLLQP